MRYLLFLLVALLSLSVQAQDTLFTKSGQSIICEVVAITKKDVRYKLPGNTNLQVRKLRIRDLDAVGKEDGTRVEFEEEEKNSSALTFGIDNVSYAAFGGGISLPFGKFGATDSLNDGYANLGGNWNVEAVYFIKPYLGLGLRTGAFYNSTDQSAWEANFQDALGLPVTLESGSWTNGYTMAGVYYSRAYDRFAVDVNMMIGIITAREPVINLSRVDNNGDLIEQFNNQASGSSFAFNPGLSVRYGITDGWGVKVGGDLFFAKPTINSIDAVYLNGAFIGQAEFNYEQNIATYNLTVSVFRAIAN